MINNYADNHGDNQVAKKEKVPHFTALFSKVVGPPGHDPGTP